MRGDEGVPAVAIKCALCAYCVTRIEPHESSETRGTFAVHRWCQIQRERNEGVYLLPDGSLRVHDHVIEPKLARSVVLSAMEHNLTIRGNHG